LLFWFNGEACHALPSAAIPFGQRYITVTLEEAQKLVFRAPAVYNILKTTCKYVPATVFVTNPDGTFDLSGGIGATVNTFYEFHYLPVYTNGAINYPTIREVSLYANNIFTHPAIHDLYIKRIGFSLVRLHRIQKQSINSADPNTLMNNFKFPCEYMFTAVLPDENGSGQWQATDWCRFAKVTHKFTKAGVYITPEANKLWDGDVLHYLDTARTIDALEVTAHGTSLYQKIDAQFFSSYLPMVFGEHTLVTPSDEGALFINFALYPMTHQPSGHINVSRAREFYIKVYSSVIGSPDPVLGGPIRSGQLISHASALNFLLVSDGSCVMRYST